MGVRYILLTLDFVLVLQFAAQVHVCAGVAPVPFTFRYPVIYQDVFIIHLPSLYQCIELCAALKLCRDYTYDGTQICVVNSNRQYDWTTNYDVKFVLDEFIPQEISGSCLGHSCAIDEMCVPAGPTYICVKHEFSTVKCPNDWGRWGDLCFTMFNERATKTEAETACASTGAELLMMESASEYEFHKNWINFQLQKPTSRPTHGTLWTGLQYTPVLPDWIEIVNQNTSFVSDMCIGLFFNETRGSYYSAHVLDWKIVSCEEKSGYICQHRAPEHWP